MDGPVRCGLQFDSLWEQEDIVLSLVIARGRDSAQSGGLGTALGGARVAVGTAIADRRRVGPGNFTPSRSQNRA